MTFAAPDPIISGFPYHIIQVDGRPPTSIDDFHGDTQFTISGDGSDHRVRGIGNRVNDSVRFHEKDVLHDGKDVRVWLITKAVDGRFAAQQVTPADPTDQLG